MTIGIIIAYLCLLLLLGVGCNFLFRKTASDFFLASRGIGPFMLLMSIFGTTMTAFALIGSTGKTFDKGIGVYGLMASWSGIVHAAIFFLVGAKVWALGKKHGYVTQLAYFRDRYRSDLLPLILFPIIVSFVMLYILMGVIGSGMFLAGLTRGAIPLEWGMAIICVVVLFYVFFGGMRATAWANTMQTIVFMVMGIVAFIVITNALGGPVEATQRLLESEHGAKRMAREGLIGKWQFLTYCFIPLSVGMFPHLFQHWLTVVAHPICILITWVPCVLLGMWASGILPEDTLANTVLARMVAGNSGPVLSGLIGAGVLAAIMSSMDSQFLCLSSLFTNDIVAHHVQHDRLSDRARIQLGRAFVIAIVVIAYGIGLTEPGNVFDIGVWCFTGFAGLSPVLFASLYWKRTNKYGAIASVLTVAALWLGFIGEVRYAAKSGEEFLLFEMMPVTLIVAASTVMLVVVTLLTPPPDRAIVEKFFGSGKA